jgi:hypothetical protein
MARQYYYLIASLPNLIFEQEAKGFDFLQLKDYVRESLRPSDYRWVEFLCAPVDIQNILNLKFNEYLPFVAGGNLTEDELKAELIEPRNLPKFIVEFLDELVKSEEELNDGNDVPESDIITDPEKRLLEKFYTYIQKNGNSFTKQWFAFDRELRNIQAAYISRKINSSIENQLIGNDDITEQLLKSNSSDFGLRCERDYIYRLWQVLETVDILEREQKLDLLRWWYIDEITTFNYFDINVVLAFVQKANLVNRWLKLDVEAGIVMFEQMVAELKQTYNVEEAFKNLN